MAREEIVSSVSEQLILVDEQDRELGFKSKGDCHSGAGLLHRAFSIFVFNGENELLLQKRSGTKPLWPNYWSNTCCSHPRRGESKGTRKSPPIMPQNGRRVYPRIIATVPPAPRANRSDPPGNLLKKPVFRVTYTCRAGCAATREPRIKPPNPRNPRQRPRSAPRATRRSRSSGTPSSQRFKAMPPARGSPA